MYYNQNPTNNYEMDTKVAISTKFFAVTIGMMIIGAAGIAYGLFTDGSRAWANILMHNYLLLSLTIGASFFFCLQYISQSGWSAMFLRIPEAIMAYIPFAGVIMLLLYFGMGQVYHWAQPGIAASDELVAHKSPWLNIPFFFVRVVLFFGAWYLLTAHLRKLSLLEDKSGGIGTFEKMEFWSKVFIFVLAISFSIASFDWIMSIEIHWISTIYAFRTFASAFYHGSALIALVIILLHQRGYYPEMNESHLLDLSRYIFALSIIWGYLTFAQFAIIWFSNLPEETVYYAKRWNNSWKVIFYVNFAINWLIPFIVLLPQALNKNIRIVKYVTILLMAGMWLDLYEMIMPEITKTPHFGIVEIGSAIGFSGLFVFVVAKALVKVPLIPKNHPYLEESLFHHVH
jgi:hypothetical protein